MQENVEYSINDLLRRTSENDKNAFRGVFDRLKRPFYGTTLKMVRSSVIAEEIVQQVFVTIWEKRRLIGASKDPEKYVFTILKNCIYTHFRMVARDDRLKVELAKQVSVNHSVPDLILQEKEKNTHFEKILKKLPSQQQLVYRMSRHYGISREEIAKRLDISSNTVRNHLAAASRSLRSSFGKL